jgi:hypothetical protein
MKKPLVFKEFGSKDSYMIPKWSCLINPDHNLTSYYDAVLNNTFSKKRFRRPGVFRIIGRVEDKESFSLCEGIRCLDMPIKMAGDKEYRIPLEFERFGDAISKMISWENAHNKRNLDFYAYLTIDQTKSNSGFHREPGCHVDGFQGARISPKVICDRSYIVLDCNCPSIWNQSFETVENMDDNTQNIFHEFDRTKHYSSEIKTTPYDIYFMDGYTVHSANEIVNESTRTFLRLSYSVRKFDRLGNSKNNCFDYKWEMVERSIAKNLK